jgi:rod shape-determining protein MreD
MLWAIYFSLHSPPRPALMMAFVTGLLTDLYIGSAIGMHTFALCVVVLVSIRLQKGWDKNNMLLVTVLVFGATLIGQSVMVLLAVLSGLSLSLWMSIQIALGVSIYNALLVVLTYPLIHRSFKRGLLGKA